MDNAKYYISSNVQKYLISEKIKIVTNVPYLSSFNSIELFFRALKNVTYKENYNTITNLRTKLEGIINDPKMDNIVKKNFIETLNNYKNFLEDNKSKYNLEEILQI